MAQQAENRVNRGEYMYVLPKVSTAISSGDVVVMGDKTNTKGIGLYKRALTDARIEPIVDDDQAQYCLGVCDDAWTSTSTGYAAPVAGNNELKIFRSGVFRLAISDTSGNAGDYVKYSSGATGAQIFAIDNERPDYAIGHIFKTFTGASANDVQHVLIYARYHDRAMDVYFNLENHVLYGGWVRPQNAGATTATICIGGTAGGDIIFRVKNRILRLVNDTTIAMPNPPGASDCIIYKIVARSGGVAIGTGTERTALVSWTGITVGNLPGLTSGECLLAYVRAWSDSKYSLTSIFNIRGVHDLDQFDAVHGGL